jgi:hypothetical protein
MNFKKLLFGLPLLASVLIPHGHHAMEVSGESVAKLTPEITKNKRKKWTGKNLSRNEQIVLEFLQEERGIRDKVALAVIMANIQQESKFEPNICEGGARVPYDRCYHGGYGLIQWTSANRYRGLGQFARRYGGDPSDLRTQLRYMVNEVQWKRAEKVFKQEGLSIHQYMNAAYRWLGWGVEGPRVQYSYRYINQLQPQA